MTGPTLEVCVDDAAGIAACVAGKADRIELCSALSLGGLTPSVGLMKLTQGCGIPTVAMIRPRAGDFTYSDAELAVMRDDIAAAKATGISGVVLGALNQTGHLAQEVLRDLIAFAAPMQVTLHRAIDTLADPVAAVDAAHALGFTRILSSGGATDAMGGRSVLERMNATAAGRIAVMAGSGVTAENVAHIARATGISAFHASCASEVPVDKALKYFGFTGASARVTDAAKIKALRKAMTQI